MRRAFIGLVAAVLVAPACWAQTAPASASTTFVGKRIAQVINRLPHAAAVANAAATVPILPNNGIAYNGGPIMDDANGVNVYYIWYGDWSKDQLAQKVLVNFITHIGGSPYFNINTTYYSYETGPNGTNVMKDRVINAVHYMGSTTDNYSQGANLTDYQVYLAVANAITSGALPADKNGVYFLLTSGDVDQTLTNLSFGTDYCGWHDSTQNLGFPAVDGVDIKLSFAGNAAPRFAYQCIYNYQTTMSGSLAADAMANVIVHELEESVTDPDYTSWVNPDPTVNHQLWFENADLCNFVFPGPYHSGSATDPQPPDMKFGGIPYLIQENWVNAKGGYCALKWDN